MYLINGEPIERVAVNDRGLLFGDGCFTTARIIHGNITLFFSHLARLEKPVRGSRSHFSTGLR